MTIRPSQHGSLLLNPLPKTDRTPEPPVSQLVMTQYGEYICVATRRSRLESANGAILERTI